MIDPQMKSLMEEGELQMTQYIVTIETNWYTKIGVVGNNANKKLPVGWTFESILEMNERRNVHNTNMWIPSANCRVDNPVPPTLPPTNPNDFVKIVAIDTSGNSTEFDLVKRVT